MAGCAIGGDGIGSAAAVGSAAAIALRGLICAGSGAAGTTFITWGWFAIICARCGACAGIGGPVGRGGGGGGC